MNRLFALPVAALLTALPIRGGSAQSEARAPANGTPPARLAKGAIVTTRPVIDGRLEDAVWREAEPIGGFVQRDPAEGEPATERTEVRFLTDG